MIRTTSHLAYVLRFDIKEINFIADNIGKFYTERRIPKKNGYRIINPSHRRLKVLQKRIQKNIINQLPLPDYAYGAVQGRDNVGNTKQHKGKRFKFATDLRNFFPSVNNRQVNEMFIKNGFSPDVAHILTRLTTYKGRLPQGAPTSSSIANLVFTETGNKLDEFALENNITFTTFVDDLAFSSPSAFKEKTPEIVKIITDDGFRISHNKTHYCQSPLITGLYPENNYLRLSEEFVNKVKNSHWRTEDQKRGDHLYFQKVQKANSTKPRKYSGAR
jgi:RNA-directed DNA polymerase